jgi:hypothetical protein
MLTFASLPSLKISPLALASVSQRHRASACPTPSHRAMPFPPLHGTPSLVTPHPIPYEWMALDDCGQAGAVSMAASSGREQEQENHRSTNRPRRWAQAHRARESSSTSRRSRPAAYKQLQRLALHKRSHATSRRSSSGHHQPGTTNRRSSPVGTLSPTASRRRHCKRGSLTVVVYAGPMSA